MLLSVFLFAILGGPSTTSLANPLAMAGNGKLQCYRPDVQKKTCQSIASYRRTGLGTYDNKAVIPLSPTATLETHTPVVIKAGAVCGFIRGQDALVGTLRLNGAVVKADKAKPILERVAQNMGQFADKEVCTIYEPSGTDFTAKISIGGTYRPDEDETVKWVSPSEGYIVTP